ncbi:MAG: hypothetical protein HYZ75_19770 [Elusimicrobia bacterium]|nr:hypothetical protein [Elusimicrobiota bacterium]
MTAFSAWSRLVRRLPGPAARFLLERIMVRGLMLGWPPNRRAARGNLRRVLAHAGRSCRDDDVDPLLDESLRLFARFLLLMAAHPVEVEAARRTLDFPMMERLKSLGAEKRGVIIATPNYGLVAHFLWALVEGGVPLSLPILNREFLAHFPPGIYSAIKTVGASATAALEALERGEIVATISDINFLPRRITTDFFGAPAPIGYAPARLALSSGAPILPVYATANGDRGVVECDEPIRPQGKTLTELHAAVAASMQRFIARRPGQWMVYEDFWDLRAMDRKYSLARRLARWS